MRQVSPTPGFDVSWQLSRTCDTLEPDAGPNIFIFDPAYVGELKVVVAGPIALTGGTVVPVAVHAP